MHARRSCFGTVLERWWAEELQGVKQVRAVRGAQHELCCAVSAFMVSSQTLLRSVDGFRRVPHGGLPAVFGSEAGSHHSKRETDLHGACFTAHGHTQARMTTIVWQRPYCK